MNGDARRGRLGAAVALGCAAVLVLAAAYEALVALGVVELGTVPGEGPPGEEYVFFAAMLALLVGGLGVAALGIVGGALPALLALLAAGIAFVVARFLTFDPYHLPTLRRMSEGGIPPVWIVLLVLLAISAAFLARARPRIGAAATGAVLLACAVTAVLMGLN